jgi:hypothetical protein
MAIYTKSHTTNKKITEHDDIETELENKRIINTAANESL